MRDPIKALIGALERDEGGIAIVWCPDLGLRQWLVNEVEALVPSDRRAFCPSSLEEALSQPDCMALWAPEDEAEAVLDLDGSRDLMRNEERPRTQPIVMFLLREGDGARELRSHATSLWSAAGGNLVDPEKLSEIDVDAERRDFLEQIGKTPEGWLDAWRAERIEHTRENTVTTYRAMLLEVP